MSMNDFASIVAGLPGTSGSGADPEVVNAIRFWLEQGNGDMARYVAAANTPGASTAAGPPPITSAQAQAAGVPDVPNPYAPPAPSAPAPPAPVDQAPAPAPSPTPPSGPDQSARAAINATLDAVGLGDLGDWAWGQYLAGSPISQILLDMRQQPSWVAQFGVINKLAAQGVAGITEADVLNYRSTVRQVLASAAIPSGFFDSKAELDQFMIHGKSAAEISANVKSAQQAALAAPQETRDALQRLYGVHPGELTAFWLDPNTATDLINQRFLSAQLAGTAAQTGYGALDQTQAERLVALGVTQGQAQTGFAQLGQQSELFRPLTGAEGAIGTDEQLAAAFGGDAGAQADIRRREAARVAVFGAGGGVSQSSQGLSGVGAAQQ